MGNFDAVNNYNGPPEPKLRILQAGPTRYSGGVTNAIKTLCLSLRRLGHDVALFTDGSDFSELESNGIECHPTDFSQRPGTLLRSAWQLRRLLKSFRPEVIHVHGRSAALRTILAGRGADWFTLHNTHLTHQVGLIDTGWIRKYLSPRATNFFALNQLGVEYLQKALGVRRDAIVQIHNGVDCQRFHAPSVEERATARAQFEVGPTEIFVVFVGRLDPIKQPHAIVDAAARAVQLRQDNLKFALIGDGELRATLTAAIDKKGVGAICKLYSWMNPLNAYFAADLVVLPSLFEGYSLVAAEAIATGCPVLHSRTGGSSHIIREGITGFQCETEAEQFVHRLFQVLEAPERLRAMRSQVREFALTHLDAIEAARLTTSAYRARMGNSAGRPS